MCFFFLYVVALPATRCYFIAVPLRHVRTQDRRGVIPSLRLRLRHSRLSYLSDSLSQSITITLGGEDLKDDEGESFSEPEDHMANVTAHNLIAEIPPCTYMSDL